MNKIFVLLTFFFTAKRSFLPKLILITIIFVGVALIWSLFGNYPSGKSSPISTEGWSIIQREKIKAQKDFAEFIKTPAGKIWQRHPYWTPETCQKIAQGELFIGMDRDQAHESLTSSLPRRNKITTSSQGDTFWEEWAIEGEAKLILQFRDNILLGWERK